ncbi:MAG: hypothetical protein ABL951_04125 [Alphaproteobacteria bacterium]
MSDQPDYTPIPEIRKKELLIALETRKEFYHRCLEMESANDLMKAEFRIHLREVMMMIDELQKMTPANAMLRLANLNQPYV